jgi:hypothetical protein
VICKLCNDTGLVDSGDIIIVRVECSCRKARRAALERVSKEGERAREVIQAALVVLNGELGTFEQTTHGCLFIDGVEIDGVAASLVKAYQKPTAYTLSNLSQYLEAFLEGSK